MNNVTLTDHFPTPFTNKIINEVAGHECYSFTNGVLGYNQVPIAKENQEKTTFVSEFSSFAYKVIPFGFKNAPTIFSRIVVKAFQEYIYKTMAIYFDDWIVYNLLKNHIHLSLNIKKCLFATPIDILLGLVVYKDGMKVDMAKIKVILDLKTLVNTKQIKIFLGTYKLLPLIHKALFKYHIPHG